jgi:hypothetical protein
VAEGIDRKQLRKAMKAQGWLEEPTRDGFRAVPPDPQGEAVAWHNTPSDWRAEKNNLARMKRQGFVFPWDKKAQRAHRRKES